MEERLVPKAGFRIETVPVSGFIRKPSWRALKHNLRAVKLAFDASRASARILRAF